MSHKFDPTLRDRARRMYAGGKSQRQVAAKLGVSQKSVVAWVKGVQAPPKKFRAKDNVFSVTGHRHAGGDQADAVTQRIRAIVARECQLPEPRRIVAAMCGDVEQAARARGEQV